MSSRVKQISYFEFIQISHNVSGIYIKHLNTLESNRAGEIYHTRCSYTLDRQCWHNSLKPDSAKKNALNTLNTFFKTFKYILLSNSCTNKPRTKHNVLPTVFYHVKTDCDDPSQAEWIDGTKPPQTNRTLPQRPTKHGIWG